MSHFFTRIRSAALQLSRRAGAWTAFVLILLALFIGYRIGRPAPVPESESESSTKAADAPAQVYTCSMHPSVRLPDPDAKCPICFMDLIPVAEDEGEGSELRVSMSESAAALSRVETAKAGRFFPVAEVRLYGKMTDDETSVARLTAYFPGRIDRLFVNYLGVEVNEGDHIAELYSPDLLASFEELRQAQASVAGGSTSDLVRRTAQDTLQAAREKLRLYGITQAQITAIEDGSFDADRLTIYAPIAGTVTHLAMREGDYLNTGDPIATVSDLTHLWLDLEAYESQLPMLRWGQPVSFTVESHPGETFEGRIAFIEPIVDERTRSAAIRVAVENPDQRLTPGMFASAVVRPRIAAGGAVLTDELAGRWVSSMHPTVVMDEPGECPVCGMDLVPAESLGIVGDPTSVEEPIVIPRTAVLFTGARSVVYVRVPGADRPTYEVRQVELGSRAGDLYIVRSGLAEGEDVVVNGAFRIDSAMQIAAKPSMMSPGGGGGGSAHAHAGHGEMSGDGQSSRGNQSIPESFIFALKPVYAAYLDAQEGLADDDLGRFVQAVSDLNSAIGFVQETGLVGQPLAAWRRSAAKLRVDGVITTIGDARARFERMSDGIIELQRRFGHKGSQTWHIAYCPMAFDNKGADWLQRGTQINNPYFGDAMLRCGEIREAFSPVDAPNHEGHNHE